VLCEKTYGSAADEKSNGREAFSGVLACTSWYFPGPPRCQCYPHWNGFSRNRLKAGCSQDWLPHRAAAITSTLKRMTKPQLIDVVSAKTGREKAEVGAVLESVLGAIAEALQENQRVDLRGFGSFVVKEKKERQGRNPRTGETITIPAKRTASFKAGKELGDTLVQTKTETTTSEDA